MRIHRALKAGIVIAAAFGLSTGLASLALAQGRPIGVFNPPQRTATPVPSSPILPMTNPVAPMTNPVSPVVPSPFIRYDGTTPTVVIPNSNRGGAPPNLPSNLPANPSGARGRGGRDVVLVPVPVPTNYYPYAYPYDYYPQEIQQPVTIPGRLPGARYEDNTRQTSFNPNPNAPAPVPASTFVYEPQPEIYSDARMIVREPQPVRVLQPPVAGTTRRDVILRLGEPWGSFTTRGNETLYFDGGLVVVMGPDGRVSQVR